MLQQLTFSWYDYILFSVMLTASALIGVYFGCFGTKQSSADEYLMGNKKMRVIPVSISLIASHISGISLLGVPADIYRYGSAYWLAVPGILFVISATIFVYLPVFYKLQITSTYEYLERRFDSTNRSFASFLFTLGLLTYLPIVIYVPALALSATTGINIHFITPLVCGVCIFYTTLGGLKAVVWTDTLQFSITTGAVITVAVIGLKNAGGLEAVWSRSSQGQRLDLLDFDPDPTKRDSFWTVIIGMSTHWLASTAIHQSCVQKFLSVSTLKEAQRCVIYFFVGIGVMVSFLVFTGLVMYAKYFNCDPFSTGAVSKNDQLLPYYIMDVASHIPGLPGLFIAGVFCAALSTLSACLNCLAGTLFEDFVLKITGPIKTEATKAFILKTLVASAGILCTGLVFVVEKLGGILALSIGLSGVTSGPLLGMFTLGVLCPKANSRGAFYGSIIGLLVSAYVVIMVNYYKNQGILVDVPKSTAIDGCLKLDNFTKEFGFVDSFRSFNSTSGGVLEAQRPFFLFRISFYYYTLFGALITMISGFLISLGFKNNDRPVHRDLISPIIHFMLPDEKIYNENLKKYYSLEKALNLVTIQTKN